MKRILSSVPKYFQANWNGYMIPETNIWMEVLTKEKQEESVELLVDMFAMKTSTFGGAYYVPKEIISQYVNLYMNAFLSEEFSLVAIDADRDNKVVGCLMSEEFHILDSQHEPVFLEGLVDFMSEHSQYFAYPADLLDFVEQYYINHCKRNGYNKVLHRNMGCVDKRYIGKGVYRSMIEQTGIICKERGFQSMFGECTSIFSHKIYGDEANLLMVQYDNYTAADGTKLLV